MSRHAKKGSSTVRKLNQNYPAVLLIPSKAQKTFFLKNRPGGGSSNSGIDHAAKWIKIHRAVHKNHCYFGVEMNADSM